MSRTKSCLTVIKNYKKKDEEIELIIIHQMLMQTWAVGVPM